MTPQNKEKHGMGIQATHPSCQNKRDIKLVTLLILPELPSEDKLHPETSELPQ